MKTAAIISIINIATFFFYWVDKRRARQGGWRVAEEFLLFMGLIGGSPAALLAQFVFRHKLNKASFQAKFWVIFFLQTGVLLYFS